MIVRISGKLTERKGQSVIIDVNGLFYEIHVSMIVLSRLDEAVDAQGRITLTTYHYLQIGPSSGLPFLIGFLSEVECEFFQQFIKVSGIGPRAAVKALDKPISDITRAIEAGDVKYLTTLPGIGAQRAKEIVAKLQGKIGKFGLIQDKVTDAKRLVDVPVDWQEEVLAVLLQLQYKKQEAVDMIDKALKRGQDIKTTEGLLNEIYKQRIKD